MSEDERPKSRYHFMLGRARDKVDAALAECDKGTDFDVRPTEAIESFIVSAIYDLADIGHQIRRRRDERAEYERSKSMTPDSR